MLSFLLNFKGCNLLPNQRDNTMDLVCNLTFPFCLDLISLAVEAGIGARHNGAKDVFFFFSLG